MNLESWGEASAFSMLGNRTRWDAVEAFYARNFVSMSSPLHLHAEMI